MPPDKAEGKKSDPATALIDDARTHLTAIRGRSRTADFASLRAAVWLLMEAVERIHEQQQ